jgi:hypothetical protein
VPCRSASAFAPCAVTCRSVIFSGLVAWLLVGSGSQQWEDKHDLADRNRGISPNRFLCTAIARSRETSMLNPRLHDLWNIPPGSRARWRTWRWSCHRRLRRPSLMQSKYWRWWFGFCFCRRPQNLLISSMERLKDPVRITKSSHRDPHGQRQLTRVNSTNVLDEWLRIGGKATTRDSGIEISTRCTHVHVSAVEDRYILLAI